MKPSDLSEFFSLLGKAKKEKEEEFDNLLKEADINLDDLTSSLVSGIKEAKEDQKKQKKNEEKLIEQLDSIIDVIENPKEVKDITEPAVTVGVPEDFDVSKLEEEDALDVQDWNGGKDVKFTEVDAVDIIKPEPIKTTEINDTVAQAIKFIEETNIKEEIENSDETNLDKLKTEIKQVRDILYKVLAHGPGSGEVNLLKLDDVDEDSAKVDGRFLKYDASSGKFVGGSGGAGSQNLDDTLGLGNTSILGMSVGVITATSFVGDGSQLTNIGSASTANVRTGILDVTGIATFRSDTLIGSGVTLSPDGDLFATGVTTSSSFVGDLTGDVTGTASNATQLNSQAASYYLNYNNFSNTPTIPSNNNQLTNGAGFITASDDITGNAATSTKLATARTIAGVSFDGSANISLNNNAITNGAGYITTSFTNTNQLTNGAGFIDGSALNASNLSSGTIPDARFPSALPAIDGSALTGMASTDNVRTGILDVAGIATFRNDVLVGSGITLSPDGDIFAVGVSTFTGDVKINNISKSITIGDITGSPVNFLSVSQKTGSTVNGFETQYDNASVFENLQGSFHQHLVLGDSTVGNNGTIFGISVTQSGTTHERLKLTGVGDLFVTRNLDVDGATTLDGLTVAEASTFNAAITASGGVVGNVTGNTSGSSGSCTGNAATATALETARNIGGVSFDGSANIDLPGVNSAGNQNTSGTAAGLSGTPSITVNAVNGTTGTFTTGVTTSLRSNKINLGDNEFINVGLSSDLQIYHDSSHSFIKDSGTGQLKILTSTLAVKNVNDNKTCAVFSPASSVELFENGTKRLETTNTGAKVTGDLEITGVLTYEDVTNVDSVGVITARSGVLVGSGITLSPDGDIFATGVTTSTTFVGALTGNVTGNTSGSSGSCTGNAATATALETARNIGGVSFDGSSNIDLPGVNSAGNQNTSGTAAGLSGTPNISCGTVAGSTGTFTTGITTSLRSNKISVGDNERINVGLGSDVQLYWTGSAGFLTNQGGGNLHFNSDTVLIKNAANSKSYIRAYNNSSVEIFHNNNKKFETAKTGAVVTGILTATSFEDGNGIGINTANVRTGILDVAGVSTFRDNINLPDNVELKLGSAGEVRLLHNGSATNFIVSQHYFNMQANGYNLYSQNGSESIITAFQNGAVNLFFDNTKRFETTNTGAVVTGILTATSNVNVGSGITLSPDGDVFTTGISTFSDNVRIIDNKSLLLGDHADGDLSILHDGNNGNIRTRTGSLYFLNASQYQLILVGSTGAVKAYHGGNLKFETTSSGVTVTGTAVATSFTGDLTGDVTGNADTATTLATARNIGGVSFDGSANIDLPGVNSAGNQNTSGTAAGLSGTPNISCGTIAGSTGSFSSNVGIATNSPQTKLHITQGTDNNTDGIRLSRSNSAASYSQYIDTSSRFNIGYSNPNTADPDPQITLRQNGRVGIGTNVPDTLLHLYGSSQTEKLITLGGGGSKRNNYIGITGSDNLEIGADEDSEGSSSSIRFRVDGSERARIDSSGNINFGAEKAVALPSGSGIQVYNSSAPRIKLVNDTTGNASGDGSYLYVTGSDFILENKESANMRLYTAATERVRITSGGQVNIGDDFTQTTYKTQIEATDNNVLRLVNDSDDTNGVELVLYKDSASPADGDGIGGIYFQGNDDGGNSVFYANIEGFASDVSDGTEDGYIRFRTRLNGSIGERVRIDSQGDMGIGTNDPQAKLHISSGNSGDCELIIEADSDNNTETDNPRILFRQDGGQDESMVGMDNNTLILANSVSSSGGIVFKTGTTTGYTNATERMRILDSGGLTFNGDTSSANAIDDYEEGTFTPTYTTSNNDIGSVNYDVRTGRYTKIGRMVYFTLRMRTDSISDVGSGTIKITGFPYTHKNSSSHRAVTNNIYSAGWTPDDSPTLGLFLSNDSALQLYQKDFNNDGAGLASSSFNTGANDNDVRMTGFYESNT